MYLKKLKKLTLFSLIITMFFSIPIYNTYADEKNNVESNSKVVYLTFDDGPAGKVTNDVLDILKNNSVHATFFLIGCQIKDQEDLVKRIYDEGNSIGLHSMTHKKNSLYCSNEQFLKEMISTQELISTVVPIKPTILRFPFGCNNNTYKISKSMVDLLHDNNLKIYDWNTDSGDGANHNLAPENIAKKACKSEDKDTVVILMHCTYINKNSAKALPSIIKYYKDKGYTFKAIDETTPELYKVSKK